MDRVGLNVSLKTNLTDYENVPSAPLAGMGSSTAVFHFLAVAIMAWKCSFRWNLSSNIFLLLASMWALAANQATLKAVGDFSWFDWVKRASLILGFLVLVSLDSDRFRRATWPVVTAQVVLFANVFEAGIFGCSYSDYVVGIFICVLSFFSPHCYTDDESGYLCVTSHDMDGGTDGRPVARFWGRKQWKSPMPARWYIRMYCILIGVLHTFSPSFHTTSIFYGLTCWIPLCLCEGERLRYGSVVSEARWFTIRLNMLFAVVVVDTLANSSMTAAMNATLGHVSFVIDDAVVRNIVHGLVVVVLGVGCHVIDRRTKAGGVASARVVAAPV